MAYDSSNLPAVDTQPLSSEQLSDILPGSIAALLDDDSKRGVFCAVKSTSGVDVGAWTGARRIWVCCLSDELLLAAAGRQHFLERVPYAQLADSQYNHLTATLVLAPATLRITQLRMKPSDALQVLAYINK